LSFVTTANFAQEKRILSGTITDAKSNETLIGVSIYDEESKKGVSTNEYGFYSLTLSAGTHTLRFSSVGYQNEILTINLQQDKKNNVHAQKLLF